MATRLESGTAQRRGVGWKVGDVVVPGVAFAILVWQFCVFENWFTEFPRLSPILMPAYFWVLMLLTAVAWIGVIRQLRWGFALLVLIGAFAIYRHHFVAMFIDHMELKSLRQAFSLHSWPNDLRAEIFAYCSLYSLGRMFFGPGRLDLKSQQLRLTEHHRA